MYANFKNNIDLFNKVLDGIWLRNKVINHNIANADTPKYKKLTVSFEDKLREALSKSDSKLVKTHEKHLPFPVNTKDIQPRIEENDKFSYRFDGNNVNIDTEMADLAKNTIMYNAVIDQLISEFDKIKNVIHEGGK